MPSLLLFFVMLWYMYIKKKCVSRCLHYYYSLLCYGICISKRNMCF